MQRSGGKSGQSLKDERTEKGETALCLNTLVDVGEISKNDSHISN